MSVSQNSSPEPIKLLFRYRKVILITSLAAAVIAALFTAPYFIPPVYKAEVLFYPPGSNSSKIMIQGASRFGSDKEIDEQIQILKSTEVRDSIILKYHLINHYTIDSTEKTWLYKLHRQYDDNINIDRTRYSSISVKVFDTDAQMAADMANDLVGYGDDLKDKIIKKNLAIALKSLEKEQALKLKEIDTLTNQINKLSGEDVFSLVPYHRKSNLEKFEDQLAIREMRNKAGKTNDYTLMELSFSFENKLNRLKDLQESYSQAYIDFSNPVPESYVISRAEPNFKKVSPQRTFIVLAVFFTGFIIIWGWIVFYEKIFRQLKQLK